ncbi:peptide ABC transporter ATP-binding protein [Gordoniibacillus kamchatkensis]|uniref:Peptide ABC transporter ATP-binding protein n=1 Tax=Gordoniibacillus kamchatkensis TaxID=1590651 RepID=A0ABR5AH25_9BACL|nr:ABC transporter ATP-binding protein [Paenibacillus sp. VKM B-2647]KIL40349.1 peptide ABC transporter ATP-binding protein [Paenibacillus sp. VKM B-2647]
MNSESDLILKVDNLQTQFHLSRRVVKAVNGVSFQMKRGRTLGVVGESGCGKSVTAHSIVQLLPKMGRIVDGSITYYSSNGAVELSKLKRNGSEMRAIRGKEIGMIFQDPMASLNPVFTIGHQIAENITQHEKISRAAAMERAVEMLTMLGIPQASTRIKDYPHQFSGGMKQRAMIALAMVCNPKLLIADEPTTALDVTIQAQILELMKEMQHKYGTSIILITHNMGIVADMADDIAVMYMGRIVEFGTVRQVLGSPRHPYTRALLQSVPVLGIAKGERLKTIRGSTPDPSDMPEGCEFAPRCDFATKQCKTVPADTDLGGGHRVRCWNCMGGLTT